jgi:histidine phosphotransferase ChpT
MLAARLCHDFISPASAIVSGLDLLDDPSAQDMREDAMSLIASSARKLADLLQFTRVAFGASASAENFDSRELEKLAQGVFNHVRPTWSGRSSPLGATSRGPRPAQYRPDGRASALPAGGVATVRGVAAEGRFADRRPIHRPARPHASRGAGRPEGRAAWARAWAATGCRPTICTPWCAAGGQVAVAGEVASAPLGARGLKVNFRTRKPVPV